MSTISPRPSRAKSGFRRKTFPMTFDSYLVKTPDGYGLKAPWCCFLGFLSAMPTPRFCIGVMFDISVASTFSEYFAKIPKIQPVPLRKMG